MIGKTIAIQGWACRMKANSQPFIVLKDLFQTRGSFSERAKWIVVAVLLIIFAGLALSSSVQKSPAWDETLWLGIGAYLLDHFRWDIPASSLHPPLSFYLNSIPLLFCNLQEACFEKGDGWDVLSAVQRGQCLLRSSHPSGDWLLFWARLPTICMGIGLGFFVFRWASQLYGTNGGLLSLFLYAFSPNILAHARLATPDFPLTFFGFVAVYYFWQHLRKRDVRSSLLCGLFLGLTLLSKYPALLWLPIFGVLVILSNIFQTSSPETPRGFRFERHQLTKIATIMAIAFLVVLLGYGFKISIYFTGIADLAKSNARLPSFLNGNVSMTGWWSYYLIALLIKTPLPGIILFCLGAIQWKRVWRSRRLDALCVALPVIMFLVAFSCLRRVNIGIRYILPIFPFIMVWSGNLISYQFGRKTLRIIAVASVLLWYSFESLSIYPHYLAYFNQLGGGPEKGYLHLVDSNLDWGQDLKGLKAYMDRENISEIKLSYFGSTDPALYEIEYEALSSFVLLNPKRVCKEIKKGDIVAVSATNLHPLYVDLGALRSYLLNSTPEAVIGHSIFIYEIGNQPVGEEGPD